MGTEHSTRTPPKVLVYRSFPDISAPLHRTLCRIYGEASVGWCTADDIRTGRLEPPVRLLVLPGGGDVHYRDALNGAGTHAIRGFVEGGGRYLGICGGAYFACAALEWAKGSEYEISDRRELGFFPGTAVGPIGGMDAFDPEGGGPIPRLTHISFNANSIAEQRVQDVYYSGGPAFTDAPSYTGIETLARWIDTEELPSGAHDFAAIVKIRVGQGLAILSAVHFELGGHDLERIAREKKGRIETTLLPLARAMQAPGIEEGRRALWDHIQHHLDIGAPEP